MLAQKSRAEYFRERRKQKGNFSVLAKRELVEALEKKLQEQGMSKVSWFEQKAEEELNKK